MDAFIQNLADSLNLPAASISSATRLTDLPNWDSLAILTTLSMLDQEYGVMLSGTQLQSSGTVADLFTRVQAARSDA